MYTSGTFNKRQMIKNVSLLGTMQKKLKLQIQLQKLYAKAVKNKMLNKIQLYEITK